MLAWSYFEKLVALENMSVDRSDGAGSLSNPMPTSAREVTVESLLDCLVWATNRALMCQHQDIETATTHLMKRLNARRLSIEA